MNSEAAAARQVLTTPRLPRNTTRRQSETSIGSKLTENREEATSENLPSTDTTNNLNIETLLSRAPLSPLVPQQRLSSETLSSSTFYTNDNSSSSHVQNQENPVANSHFYSENLTNEIQESRTDNSGSGELQHEQTTVGDHTENAIVYILEYDFEALNAGELGAKEGQIVNCLTKHDQKGNPEWWFVEYGDQQGYIPRDYLSPVNANQLC